MKAYFISDIHLNSADEKKAQILLGFFYSFKSLDQITHLFLLGDIFDLWVAGHDYFKKKFQPVISELVRLKSLGVEIHYFEGNHDLYLEHFFGNELGLTVHKAAQYFELAGRKIRIEHGDQMDPADHGYRFLRWLLRTPVVKGLAPHLPESIVIWLGEKMSETSRKYTSEYKTISQESAQAVIRSHARRVWRKQYFELIISGHVHVVEDYEFPMTLATGETKKIRAINLGSWYDGARALFISEKAVEFIDLV